MARRQRDWARRERDRLHALLGGKCQACGTSKDLTLDCKIPMGGDHHRIEWSARISFYRAMLTLGNLALLCGTCNARKGDHPTIRTGPLKRKLLARLADLRAKRKIPPPGISSAA